MHMFKLKKEYQLLLFNKMEFIHKIHEDTGMSLILSSELFFTLFKDKKEFSFQELDDIIETHPSRLLYINKIQYIIDRA